MSEERLGFVISDTARLMRKRFDQAARAIGVTRAQWQVLLALSRNEGINQGGLAERLEVEPITLCRMVDRLEEAELVERRPDPNDRRAWQLYLTPAAKPVIEQLRKVGEEVQEEAFAGIPEAQRSELLGALIQVRANLSAKPADANHTALRG